MSRQEKRAHSRKVNKKIGKLISLRGELFSVKNGMTARKNVRHILQLEQELIQAGVIKRPNVFKRFFGRMKATIRALRS